MEKEEIFVVFLLFKKYRINTLLNFIHGICLAVTLEEDPQLWLDYANTLQKQEEAIFRLLQVAASSGKQDIDLSKACIFIETGMKKKKNKIEIGHIGMCKGVLQIE